MKLVDEKGKLFGAVNLIDFFVILFLLAMIPALYFGYKVMSQRPQALFGTDVKDVQLKCKLIKLKTDVAQMISVEDKELDDKGRVIGEIIWLGPVEPYDAEPSLKQCSAKLKLKAQFKGADIYYKDKVIDYGSEIDFEGDKYKANAKVEEGITKMLNTRITLKDLDEKDINLIAVGDGEIDASGRVVAEIIKLGKPEDNLYEVDLMGGNFTIGKEATKKQIPAELMLRCQMVKEGGSNQVYFKGKRVTYNSPLEFVTDKYAAIGLIAKTYEIIPEKQFRWATVKMEFKGVITQIVDTLNMGDIEKDFFGSVTARVVKVISSKPTELLGISEGKLVTLNILSQRDLILVLDILCEERGDAYYFKDSLAKMGNTVTISTKLYSITGTIIGMEIK